MSEERSKIEIIEETVGSVNDSAHDKKKKKKKKNKASSRQEVTKLVSDMKIVNSTEVQGNTVFVKGMVVPEKMTEAQKNIAAVMANNQVDLKNRVSAKIKTLQSRRTKTNHDDYEYNNRGKVVSRKQKEYQHFSPEIDQELLRQHVIQQTDTPEKLDNFLKTSGLPIETALDIVKSAKGQFEEGEEKVVEVEEII
jgi:hypothetical protein